MSVLPVLSNRAGKDRMPIPSGGFYIRPGRGARIRGSTIVWPKTSKPPRAVNPQNFTLLRDFCALADGTDKDLCAFANKYAPLTFLEPEGGEREPLDYWRLSAAQVKEIITVATKLQERQRVARKEWIAAGLGITTEHPPPPDWPEESQRFALNRLVNGALATWSVAAGIRWLKHEVRFELQTPTLMTAIGAQLLSALCRKDQLYFCAHCGRPYQPKRKPREDQNRYCTRSICKKAGKLDAQREYDERQRLERERLKTERLERERLEKLQPRKGKRK